MRLSSIYIFTCVLSQNCEIVTRLLQDCCKIVKKSSHVLCPNLRKIVARLLQDCYETDARLMRDCCEIVTRLLQDCGKIVEKIHMCYVYSRGHFTGCTHNLTQPHLTLPNLTNPNPTQPNQTYPDQTKFLWGIPSPPQERGYRGQSPWHKSLLIGVEFLLLIYVSGGSAPCTPAPAEG